MDGYKLELRIDKDFHLQDYYYFRLYMIHKDGRKKEIATATEGFDFYGEERHGLEFIKGFVRGLLTNEQYSFEIFHTYAHDYEDIKEEFLDIDPRGVTV